MNIMKERVNPYVLSHSFNIQAWLSSGPEA